MDKWNWVLTSDRLPEQDGNYIICFGDGSLRASFYQSGKWFDNFDYPSNNTFQSPKWWCKIIPPQ